MDNSGLYGTIKFGARFSCALGGILKMYVGWHSLRLPGLSAEKAQRSTKVNGAKRSSRPLTFADRCAIRFPRIA